MTAKTPDPTSHEGLVARFAHAWRVFRHAPTVDKELHAAQLDQLVAEHEAGNPDTPNADAAVAVKAKEQQAAADAKAADK